MVKLSGLVFLGLMCFFTPSATASTDIEFAVSQSADGFMSDPFLPSAGGSGGNGVISLKLVDNQLMIKSADVDYLINFENKVIVYRGPLAVAGTRDEKSYGERKFTFDEIRSRGLSPDMDYFQSYLDFQNRKFVKPKYTRDYSVGRLSKWEYRGKSPFYKENLQIWTTADIDAEVSRLAAFNRKLIEECGIVIRIKGLEDWLQIFHETGELPLVIHSKRILIMPFGALAGSSDHYLTVRTIQGATVINQRTLDEVIQWKNMGEHIRALFEKGHEKFGWMMPLGACLSILLLFFLPSWWPRALDALIRRDASRGNQQNYRREQLMRLFNHTNYLKTALAGKKVALDQSFSLEEFEKNSLYQKKFSSADKKRFERIKKLTEHINSGRQDFLPEMASDLDEMMRLCDLLMTQKRVDL